VRRGLRICFAAGEYFGVVWLLPVLTQYEFQDAGAAMYASYFWPLFQPRFPFMPVFKLRFVHFIQILFRPLLEHSRARQPQPDAERASYVLKYG